MYTSERAAFGGRSSFKVLGVIGTLVLLASPDPEAASALGSGSTLGFLSGEDPCAAASAAGASAELLSVFSKSFRFFTLPASNASMDKVWSSD